MSQTFMKMQTIAQVIESSKIKKQVYQGTEAWLTLYFPLDDYDPPLNAYNQGTNQDYSKCSFQW